MTRKHLCRYMFLAAICTFGATATNAASLTLDTPALFGAPDATVGWGFTIESTPIQDGDSQITPWLLITFADFVPDTGVNPVGVFTPFITQFPNTNVAIGPATGNGELNPWVQAYNALLLTGIGSYHINDFQSLGDTVTGNVVLFYDVYRASPNDASFDSITALVATGQTVTAPASVTVEAPLNAPEPATICLLGAGCLLLFHGRRIKTVK